ncbi:aminopeptidase [Tindallia californiensis]|uniref:Aminopeptidase II. Metallo peptidase. MEROPS family M29 n=1 Tax=Tindallia californiensis TaxID=159292 RepID=A0A1H3IK84_9FIRM|nr:aminopeptidase [Tindallia californiensis]SDY28082.1 aminopeptidase II. Metallo peptidase. MEROPS family M29 [Tindallia californiensis]
MKSEQMKKYAEIVIKIGVNLQPEQKLVIKSPIETAEFARTLSSIAFDAGAGDVIIDWKDELHSKIKYQQAPEKVFESFPSWQKDFHTVLAEEGAAFISIAANDPELMKDVNPAILMKHQKTINTALKEYRNRLMGNQNAWNVIAYPTSSWAKKVFPDLPESEAVEQLGEAIITSVRANLENPIQAWEDHKKSLKKRMDFLNTHRFDKLHFQSEAGTDLIVKLPTNHLWTAGAEKTQDGTEFIANMPTEEVFTLPHKDGVYGTVVSSKPLPYNGNLIEDFSLTFDHGKVVNYTAAKGYETLKGLLETDEGSLCLGEVALVPYDSPISNAGILFYNTLFDENASCHLALGKAYPVCLENGNHMSADELSNAGVNESLVHEDFMIGTSDMNITGITKEGAKIPIFINGNFVDSVNAI